MKKITTTILLMFISIASFSQEYENVTVLETRDSSILSSKRAELYRDNLQTVTKECKSFLSITNDILTRHVKKLENNDQKRIIAIIAKVYRQDLAQSSRDKEKNSFGNILLGAAGSMVSGVIAPGSSSVSNCDIGNSIFGLMPFYEKIGMNSDDNMAPFYLKTLSSSNIPEEGLTFTKTLLDEITNYDETVLSLIPNKIRDKDFIPYVEKLQLVLQNSVNGLNNELALIKENKYPSTFYTKGQCKAPVVVRILKRNRENYYNNVDFLDSLDTSLQKKGWEWLDDEDNIKEVSTTYPKEETYKYHINHPEYKLKYPYVYDKNDNLVFVECERRGVRTEETYDQKLYLLLERHDFLANKYNVQHDKKEVVIRIKKDVGLLPEGTEVLRNIAAMTHGRGKARLNGYLHVMNSLSIQEEADKFAKQSAADHEDDLRYVFEIKRLDNVSFSIRYMNSKGESSLTVKKHYFISKNGTDFKLELLPTEKVQLVRIQDTEYTD